MPEEAVGRDDLRDLSDLEKRMLVVLSLFETSRESGNADEYVFPDGRRIKPTLEGIKQCLREGQSIAMERMRGSAEQLLRSKLVTRKSDLYFLSDAGKKVGKTFRIERMSKGYDELLSRTGNSKAYSMFCERVFGKDLSQFNVLDMAQLNTLLEKLELKPGEVVLDLGCGTGRIAEYISDRTGAKMVGLDFAVRVVEDAQQRTLDKKERLTYVAGNMDDLAFAESSFDAIISIDTLYFVESIDLTIRKLRSLLAPPNGRLAIFCDQTCGPDESREILLPENTRVGVALGRNGLAYETVDYTSSSRGIWIREIAAAEELKELFVKEGNGDIYDDRVQDAKRTLETIESGRHVRYFYLATLKKQTRDAPTIMSDVSVNPLA
jgi:SAM-dependent methyltransferase